MEFFVHFNRTEEHLAFHPPFLRYFNAAFFSINIGYYFFNLILH